MTGRLTVVPPPCETDLGLPLLAKIRVRGATLADVLLGLDAARAAIADELLMGYQANSDGSYEFSLEGAF